MLKLTAFIEKDNETGLYIAIVPAIPGAHTQAETLDELHNNLKEVIELCLEQIPNLDKPPVKQKRIFNRAGRTKEEILINNKANNF